MIIKPILAGVIPVAVILGTALTSYADRPEPNAIPNTAKEYFLAHVTKCLNKNGYDATNQQHQKICRDQVAKDQDDRIQTEVSTREVLLKALLKRQHANPTQHSNLDTAKATALLNRTTTSGVTVDEYLTTQRDYQHLNSTMFTCLANRGFNVTSKTELFARYIDDDSPAALKSGLNEAQFQDRAAKAQRAQRECQEPLVNYEINVGKILQRDKTQLTQMAQQNNRHEY